MAVGASILSLCSLQSLIQELDYTPLLQVICDRTCAIWNNLEEAEPLEAFASGAVAVTYSKTSPVLENKVYQMVEMISKDDLNLSGIEIQQVEGVLSVYQARKKDLEKFNASKFLRHRKMIGRFPLEKESDGHTGDLYRQGKYLEGNLSLWIETLENSQNGLKKRLDAIGGIAGILLSKCQKEKSKRSAFQILSDLVDPANDIDLVFRYLNRVF